MVKPPTRQIAGVYHRRTGDISVTSTERSTSCETSQPTMRCACWLCSLRMTSTKATIAIDRAVETSPSLAHPDIRLINVPVGANPTLASPTQVIGKRRGQFGLPKRTAS